MDLDLRIVQGKWRMYRKFYCTLRRNVSDHAESIQRQIDDNVDEIPLAILSMVLFVK